MRTSWTTASFGTTARVSEGEFIALRDHLARCSGADSRVAALQCLAAALQRAAGGRFVTSLLGFTLLVGAAAVLLQ
ncbi:MAG: hypothetical protein EPO01_07355 [Aquabacterium sp.]|jgi:hypothetical protein|nr:MAG: hypothetical protein EPO12_15260 [Aquabacterium sp.]TAL23301.1 MAG: hypothetical protein EPO01_07355 [Aquabacterium sp.]